MKTRSYLELRRLKTFELRFRYLALSGGVGIDTFGFDRYLNQAFYSSPEWKHVRNDVIARDLGCDLGIEGYEIYDKVLVHHMNPITKEQVLDRDPSILDPNFLITVTHRTHNAIHYGDTERVPEPYTERRPGDTKLW